MNVCRKLTAAIIGVCTLVLSIDAGADHDEEPRERPSITLSSTLSSPASTPSSPAPGGDAESDSSAVAADSVGLHAVARARSPERVHHRQRR